MHYIPAQYVYVKHKIENEIRLSEIYRKAFFKHANPHNEK